MAAPGTPNGSNQGQGASGPPAVRRKPKREEDPPKFGTPEKQQAVDARAGDRDDASSLLTPDKGAKKLFGGRRSRRRSRRARRRRRTRRRRRGGAGTPKTETKYWTARSTSRTRSKSKPKSKTRSKSRSPTPKYVPRNGSVVTLTGNLAGTGAGGSQGKVAKVVRVNKLTGKAIIRLFYNSSDHVLPFANMRPATKADKKSEGNKKSHRWDPYKAPESWNTERLNA